MNKYNFLPQKIDGAQFLCYKQPGAYMTDYRSSSDMYAYLVNNSGKDIKTSHQLRLHLQNNAENLISGFMGNTMNQFLNMKVPGAPNTCTNVTNDSINNDGQFVPSTESVIYSGGNIIGTFPKDCSTSCSGKWINSPLPQQSRKCV